MGWQPVAVDFVLATEYNSHMERIDRRRFIHLGLGATMLAGAYMLIPENLHPSLPQLDPYHPETTEKTARRDTLFKFSVGDLDFGYLGTGLRKQDGRNAFFMGDIKSKPNNSVFKMGWDGIKGPISFIDFVFRDNQTCSVEAPQKGDFRFNYKPIEDPKIRLPEYDADITKPYALPGIFTVFYKSGAGEIGIRRFASDINEPRSGVFRPKPEELILNNFWEVFGDDYKLGKDKKWELAISLTDGSPGPVAYLFEGYWCSVKPHY